MSSEPTAPASSTDPTAPTDPATTVAASEPGSGEGMPERVIATWQTNVLGQRRGHVEELDVTPAVLGAAADGKLSLATLDGEPVPIPRVVRTSAARRVDPPSARNAARTQAAPRRPARSGRAGRRGG
ncbi:hypothetical protein [Thermomonospora cellulosilytica]|uniref:Uncharacterized protein n=1 Tax=Thermomonospora cellulosilytica TaxID=1411118 RepID=A0A7W3N1P0_9ACTN|nr:hypothetical protein [Thermomonospora cellulosilytica]MBA9005935.1 hypothetical protein [Thermomonospora cellulosilytica]